MKMINRLEKSKNFWFLVIISVVFFLLRLPSLFEPYWYGDEGIYQAVAILINNGEQLYSGAWENKPPLLLGIYALLNSDQFLLRSLSLVVGLISIWFFFLTSHKLFPLSKYAAIISTTIYVLLFGTRFIEGNIANAENFMILPITISAYLIVSSGKWKKSVQYKIYLLAGILLSIAFLIKTVAVFDFLAFFVFLLIFKDIRLKEKIKEKLIPYTIGFSIPILLTGFYFLITQNFKDFSDALLLSNVSYVGYGNELLFPQGLLFLKGLLILLLIGIIFYFRKKMSMSVIFISLWFGFSLFNAFFAQRPYAHYLITLLPSFCLMFGLIIEEKKWRLPILGYFLIGVTFVYLSFNLKFEFTPYYKNIISFVSGQISVSEYQAFFDRNTPRDYEIARYIRLSTDEDEKIFIWGNNAQVYKLADKTPIIRYTVAYHINNFPKGYDEMEKAINNKKPKLIIIMPNLENEYPFSLENYYEKINIRDAKIYERIL